MTDSADLIREVYGQVGAPRWAATNLDALADVLRDLSWLPEGPVEIRIPSPVALGEAGGLRVLTVLLQAVDETADGPHPIRLVTPVDG
jgi:Barstar (barnase inhibitor)